MISVPKGSRPPFITSPAASISTAAIADDSVAMRAPPAPSLKALSIADITPARRSETKDIAPVSEVGSLVKDEAIAIANDVRATDASETPAPIIKRAGKPFSLLLCLFIFPPRELLVDNTLSDAGICLPIIRKCPSFDGHCFLSSVRSLQEPQQPPVQPFLQLPSQPSQQPEQLRCQRS